MVNIERKRENQKKKVFTKREKGYFSKKKRNKKSKKNQFKIINE
jgi:hypothetical protein